MGKNKNKKKAATPFEKKPGEGLMTEVLPEQGIAVGDADEIEDEGEGEAGVGENAVVDMNEGDDDEPVDQEAAAGDGDGAGDESEIEEESEEEVAETKSALVQHEEKEAAREMSKDEEAHFHLEELVKFCHGKKPEHLNNDHGVNRIHHGLICELNDNIRKGKKMFKGFSDGHRELLKTNYLKLTKAGKIKS